MRPKLGQLWSYTDSHIVMPISFVKTDRNYVPSRDYWECMIYEIDGVYQVNERVRQRMFWPDPNFTLLEDVP